MEIAIGYPSFSSCSFLPFVLPALSGCCLFVLVCFIFAWSPTSWWPLHINFGMLLYEVVMVTLC
jgi:hypothetical protein